MITQAQLKEARKLMATQGGKAGGPARAKALSAARRREIASQGAKAMHKKRRKALLDKTGKRG